MKSANETVLAYMNLNVYLMNNISPSDQYLSQTEILVLMEQREQEAFSLILFCLCANKFQFYYPTQNTFLEQSWSAIEIYLLTQSLTLCFYCSSQYVAVKTVGKYLSGIIEGLDLLL